MFDAYASDPEVTRFLTWPTHENVERAQAFLRRCDAVRLDGHRGEIGYVLARSAWGQGYATEAARAIVAWGLAQPGVYRVWAVCDVENVASARVMEKAGMTREACLRAWAAMPAFPTPRDVWCYAAVGVWGS